MRGGRARGGGRARPHRQRHRRHHPAAAAVRFAARCWTSSPRASTPAVAVASGQPDKRICAIGIDDYRAAYEMTRHLISLGHLRIGFIIGHPNQTASARRLAGFREAMAERGTRGPRRARGAGHVQLPLGPGRRRGAARRRAAPHRDLREQRRHGRGDRGHRAPPAAWTCPGDLTVAGFDDAALATTIWPELTTVRQPITDMAGAAVELLVRQIRARRAGDAGAPEHVVMDFSLIRRQSDAAPRVRPPVAIVSTRERPRARGSDRAPAFVLACRRVEPGRRRSAGDHVRAHQRRRGRAWSDKFNARESRHARQLPPGVLPVAAREPAGAARLRPGARRLDGRRLGRPHRATTSTCAPTWTRATSSASSARSSPALRGDDPKSNAINGMSGHAHAERRVRERDALPQAGVPLPAARGHLGRLGRGEPQGRDAPRAPRCRWRWIARATASRASPSATARSSSTTRATSSSTRA